MSKATDPGPIKGTGADLRIVDIEAFATSYPLPADGTVKMGVGRAIKRDAVVVKVTTAGGLIGYGESHHGRAHTAIANLVNVTLRQLVLGMDASDTVGVWSRIYAMQLSGHGMGAGTSMAMSGIDLALWDIRGKAVGWPLWKLLGGSRKPIPAYAGGVSLGHGPADALVDEARPLIEMGYQAIKLRSGDRVGRDIARIAAARKAFGDDLAILTDANTGYSVADARAAMPALDACNVGWLEEPFPAHDYRSYREAKSFGRVPLAAGENHYTRFEFNRVIEDGSITILQPDLAKSGGITEGLRIAAMASAYKLPIHPHTAMTGLSMAATVHFLAAIDNAGYFEADVGKTNLLRDELVSKPFEIDGNGCVTPLDRPGIGLEVDENFLKAYPAIEGPSYV
jgi:D-galactarolactone cycloisomerase